MEDVFPQVVFKLFGLPVRDTDPPLCSAHGGGSRPPGAPPGNRNAVKHGAYARQAIPAGSPQDSGDEPPDLASRIRDLDKKVRDLSTYIDNLSEKENKERYPVLLALYGELVSRLGRLMRDQRALSGEAADGIAGAIAQALDELSTEMGTDL